MGHHHQRHLLFPVNPRDEFQNETRVFAIEISRGLVREKNGRAVRQAPGDRYPLSLTPGKLSRKMIGALFQTHGCQQRDGAVPPGRGRRWDSNMGICTFSIAVKVGSR